MCAFERSEKGMVFFMYILRGGYMGLFGKKNNNKNKEVKKGLIRGGALFTAIASLFGVGCKTLPEAKDEGGVKNKPRVFFANIGHAFFGNGHQFPVFHFPLSLVTAPFSCLQLEGVRTGSLS